MVVGIPVDPRVPFSVSRSKWLIMSSQNDQNAFKMRLKTRHGHKRGALRVPGRPGQIWFAFSFIGLEKGSK